MNLSTRSSMLYVGSLPVPIDIKHLTSGCRLPVLGHQISMASSSTWSTGLLAPRAPSTNFMPSMETGLKKVVAADVARAAWQMVALTELLWLL